jgi:hypothetical protein
MIRKLHTFKGENRESITEIETIVAMSKVNNIFYMLFVLTEFTIDSTVLA